MLSTVGCGDRTIGSPRTIHPEALGNPGWCWASVGSGTPGRWMEVPGRHGKNDLASLFRLE